VAPRKNRFSKDEPISLRPEQTASDFSLAQQLYLGAFVAAMLMGGNAVYATLNGVSQTVRLKLYVEGEQYADVLGPRDDFAQLLGDYAKQFGVLMYYQDLYAALHAGGSAGALGVNLEAVEVPGKDKTPAR